MIRSPVTSLIAASAATLLPAPAQELPRIAPGATHAGELVGGQDGVLPARFELVVDDAGTLTISAESFAIDVDLVLERDGATLLEAPLGGLGTDARASFEAEPGARTTVLVRSAANRPGPFTLRVVAGPEPLPAGHERFAAELGYWSSAVEATRTSEHRAREIVALAAAGQFAFELGRYDESLERFESCLERAGAAKQETFEVLSHAFIGSILATRFRTEEATRHLLEARDGLGRSHASLKYLEPFVSRSLGDLHVAHGDLDLARAEYERMLSSAQAIGQHALGFEALGSLARVAEAQGAIEEALSLHERRVSEASAADGDPSQIDVLSRALFELGRFMANQGELEQAREALLRAHSVADQEVSRISATWMLGEVEARAGRLGSALTHYEGALEASTALGNERAAALCLQGAAEVRAQLGDFRAAEEQLRRAVELDAGPEVTSSVWGELGVLHSREGDLEAALRAHREALRIAEGAQLIEQVLRCRINASEVEQELGRLDQAREHARAALEAAQSHGLVEVAALASVNLAYTELLSGDPATAAALASEALAVLERVGQRRVLLAPLETLARAALAQGEIERAWEWTARAFDAMEEGGAGSLEIENASRFRSQHAWWGETLAQDATAAALNASEGAGREDTIARGLSYFGAWRNRALVEASRGTRLQWQELAIDVPGLRSAVLPEGVALIEFAPGSRNLYAYVLDANQLEFVDLGRLEDLTPLAVSFASDVAQAAPIAQVVDGGSRLYRSLISPALAALDDGPDVLILGCSDAFADVPFDALVVDRSSGGEPVYLVERFVTIQGVSGSLLGELANRERTKPSREQRGLLVGDPLYSSEPVPIVASLRGPDPFRFERLEATRDEACTVARLMLEGQADGPSALRLLDLLDERSGSMETPAFTLCIGDEATVDRVLEELPRHGFVHIGAHGIVDVEDPLRNALALTFDPERGGLLSARDILELDLDLNLAVLSACSTARGEARRGEGVLSLARAFLQAGSQSVIASLWPVRDLETSLLMRGFYRRWLGEGLHPAMALREAKLEQRSRGGIRGRSVAPSAGPGAGHPYFWAAQVYSGCPPRD